MAKDPEENGDEKEFVFEEEVGLGDPEEVVEDEIEEELVIVEGPEVMVPAPAIAARRPKAKKSVAKKPPAKAAKKKPAKAKKRAKAAPKKGKKKPARKVKKSKKRR